MFMVNKMRSSAARNWLLSIQIWLTQLATTLKRFFNQAPISSTRSNSEDLWLDPERLYDLQRQWNDMLRLDKSLCWTENERQIIATAIAKNAFCEVRIENQEGIFQTVILGAELDSGRLFSDEIFPKPDYSLNHRLLQLRIPSTDQYLNLEVKIERAYQHQDLEFQLTVISKSLSRDRRLLPRVQFPANCSPKVNLLLPCHGQRNGILVNLSSGGCLIQTVGDLILLSEHQSGECTIKLSKELALKLNIQIKHAEQRRHNGRFCYYRATFVGLSDTQREQLEVFIDNIAPDQYHVYDEPINRLVMYE